MNIRFKLGRPDEDHALVLNHDVRADNIFLFATSVDMMRSMVRDVHLAFGRFGNSIGERYFLWRADSLEVICAVMLIKQTCVIQGYTTKSKFVILVECLDEEDNAAASLDFNFGWAGTIYFQNQMITSNTPSL